MQLRRLAAGTTALTFVLLSAANVRAEPALSEASVDTDATLFVNRCSGCHTIGGGDVRDLAGEKVGPDLFNVTRKRDREWLERWLKEPDEMLEEEDPLAMEMYREWNRVPMPNLRLTQTDVDSLLGFIARKSRRIRDMRSGKIADHGGHSDHERGHGAAHDGHGGEHADHAAHAPP